MADGDDPFDFRPDELARLRRADLAAYAELYAAAAPSVGTGCLTVDSTLAFWNPLDEDPGFNLLLGLETVTDPDAAWASAEATARAGGARVFGVGVPAEPAGWVAPERLATLGLSFDHDELVWAMRLPRTRDAATPSATPIEIGVEH